MIEHNAPFDVPSEERFTPLYEAISNGRVKAARELIQRFHCDTTYLGVHRFISIHYMALAINDNEVSEFLDLLIQTGVDIHAKSDDGSCALHTAAHYDNAKCAEELLKRAPDLAIALNDDNQTPLHVAAVQGSPAVTKVILKYDKQSSKAQDSYENLPLSDAARLGHIECVELLVTSTPVDCKGRGG